MKSQGWSAPADLRSQVQRYWDSGRLLSASLQNESLFPLELKLRAPDTRACSERFEEVRQWIRELESDTSFHIDWTEFNYRVLGRNRIPARVWVRSECEALQMIGKSQEFNRFHALHALTLQTLPELSTWFARKPSVVLRNADDWEQIVTVLLWFRAHSRSGLYLRQLDIAGVDTKFIEHRKTLLAELLDSILQAGSFDADVAGPRNFEGRYGLVEKPLQIRFRILDRRLAIRSLMDLAVPVDDFAALDLPIERVFITENEINGLSFPSVPASVVIFGLGYGLERLSKVGWLQSRSIHYWGDIDTHGFHILDCLRASFPHAQSFLMDRVTLLEHGAAWCREPTSFRGDLRRLTEAEGALYHDLKYNRFGEQVRLEQERIRYGWVESALRGLAGST